MLLCYALKLRNKVFVIEQDCIYQDCDGKDLNAFHLIGTENNEVVAYLRILKKNVSFDEASIGRVVVDNSQRGKGTAREMMLKAIEFVKKEFGESEIKISAQEYLVNFYRSLGFQKVSETYLEDGIPHVEMLYRKNL